MDFISNFIGQFSLLSPNSLKLFKELTSFKKLKKGDIICHLNEVPSKFYILKSGIVRTYIVDERGKEYIRTLFSPITTTGSFSALVLQKPSRFTYDCLTDCEVYEADFNAFLKLAEQHKDVCNMYNKVLEQLFITMETRILDLSILNATERYLKLKKKIPDVDNLIHQYHIASYLNITPVQLSRIRKNLYSK